MYLEFAFFSFPAFLPFRRISKLYTIKEGQGFESHPLRQVFRINGIDAILIASYDISKVSSNSKYYLGGGNHADPIFDIQIRQD